MTSASQFRPNGPPALRTGRYARELQEVRALGTADPLLRTPAQDLIANWHREQGQFQVNRIAREAVVSGTFDLLTSARLFALLNVATMDAVQSVFEAKYFYNFWRPITAIRNADTDGNRATAPDPTWAPFLGVTPPHPEYPSAHAVVHAAGVTVLEAFLGRSRWRPRTACQSDIRRRHGRGGGRSPSGKFAQGLPTGSAAFEAPRSF